MNLRRSTLALAGGALLLAANTSRAAIAFSENFGTLADGTALTPSNTSLNYIRTGTAGTAPAAKNPSTIGTGASATFASGTTTSLTGIGASGLATSDLVTLDITIKPTDPTLGDLFLAAGSGTTFTGNTTFAGADLLFAIQSDNGNLQYRSGTSASSAWTNFSPALTLTAGTSYALKIIANNSGASFAYPGGTVATGTMDVYANGSQIGNDLDIVGAQSSTAFRLYATNGTPLYEVDNIVLTNETPVPEPVSFALLGLCGAGLLRRRRRA